MKGEKKETGCGIGGMCRKKRLHRLTGEKVALLGWGTRLRGGGGGREGVGGENQEEVTG